MDKNSISKKLITLCILDLDYCDLTFGISPCAATGAKCYNTFRTCIDKANFDKTTKEYRFINNDAPTTSAADLNARPYILDISPLSTELKDDKTIPARGTITFADEEDYDKGVDPYWSSRSHTDILNVPGTFWKKLLERNPYYKGRRITIKQGYPGQNENQFETIFSGKIQKISRSKRELNLEYSDDIIDLSKIEYPYKTNIKITQDLGACYESQNRDEMLSLKNVKLNDYCLRKDFGEFVVNVTGVPSEVSIGYAYYVIIAYDSLNKPIARNELRLGFITGNEFITFNWDDVPGASYYRIYGADENLDTYEQFTNSYYECYINTSFNNSGTPPFEAERYFKFTGDDPTNPYYWIEQLSPITLDISATTDLPVSGYLQVNEEIIYFNSFGSNQLIGLKRIQFKTKTSNHYAGTNVKLVEYDLPNNPYTLLKGRISRAGIPDERVDLATINALEAAYIGINYSTKPIIKSTNAGKLFFDLTTAMDISAWINEQGKLTVKENNNEIVNHSINDAENIILNSGSVDQNDEEIKTRINFYWNRSDVTKAIDDKENYKNLHIEINADAEGENMYNESIAQDITTTWINEDCGELTDINLAVQNICQEKLRRLAAPRPKLTFDVELKDSAIKVGDIVQFSSALFNNVDGLDYQNKKAQVVKKNPKGLKIELTVRLLAEDSITTSSEDHALQFENPIPLRSFGMNEIKVSGFKVIGLSGTEYTADNLNVNEEVKLKLQWNNFYASSPATVTDINGISHALPKRLIYIGYPPAPYDEEIDNSSVKTVKRYKIYLWVANTGQTVPATKRPTTNDANGKWYLAGSIPDLHSNDDDDVYTFTYNIPISLTGRYIGFDVYADANVVYDPNTPQGLELEVLQ